MQSVVVFLCTRGNNDQRLCNFFSRRSPGFKCHRPDQSRPICSACMINDFRFKLLFKIIGKIISTHEYTMVVASHRVKVISENIIELCECYIIDYYGQ